jgi:hypothetical protein
MRFAVHIRLDQTTHGTGAMRQSYLATVFGSVLAISGSALLAQGEHNYVNTKSFLPEASWVDLYVVRSSADGIVEIVDPLSVHVVGSKPVHAGANSAVRVQISGPARRNLLAVLRHGDAVVAQRRLVFVDLSSDIFQLAD